MGDPEERYTEEEFVRLVGLLGHEERKGFLKVLKRLNATEGQTAGSLDIDTAGVLDRFQDSHGKWWVIREL